MASPLSSFGKAPAWQILLGGTVLAAAMTAGWYFTYYEDASNALQSAKAQNEAAKAELAKMQKKLENFEQEQLQVAKDEAKMQELIRKIPRSSDTVDHLMKPFQRQARLVGFDITSWAPGGEQRFDYYAKTPVEIHAQGTWHQTAEFFRKVSEMTTVVNVEEVRISLANNNKALPEAGVQLKVDFTMASFRFLNNESLNPIPVAAAPAPAEGAAAGTGAAAPTGAAAATGDAAADTPEAKAEEN